jgi:hypothetical protein
MMQLSGIAILALTLAAPAWPAEDPKSGAKGSPKSGTSRQRTTEKAKTLSGCLDQRGESYVLMGTSATGVLATLQGKGFSNDNFARYVGHKVTLHGEIQKDGETTVMHVTRVEDGGSGCTSR